MNKDLSLYIYDTNFNPIAIVDEWISLIWKSVFNGDVGGFDLQVPATKNNIDIFKPDYFVERSDKYDWRPTAKASGGKSMMQCRDLMIIEAIEIRGESDGDMTLTIGGVHITSLLKRRINIDPFNTFGNEFNGFWGKMSQELIFNDISSTQSLQIDHRRGLPLQKLLSYEENAGGIYDAQHLGFLTTFTAKANTNDVVPSRATNGFPVTGRAIIYPDPSIGTDIYLIPNFYWPGANKIVKTTDNQYLIAVGIRAQYNGNINTETYYLLSRQPPRPAYPITNINYSLSQLILVHPYNTDRDSYEYRFLITSDYPPLILKPEDSGAAFVICYETLNDLRIGIMTSGTEATDPTRGVVTGTVLVYSSLVERRTLFQKKLFIDRENWFDILTSIVQENDVALYLYYDDITDNEFRFAIYDGENRDIEFSTRNANLTSFKKSVSQEEYANIEYIVGTYPANPSDEDIKEIDLVTYTPQSVPENILRREVVVKSDASYRDGDYIIAINEFRDSLISAAANDLAQNHKTKEDYDCEIIADNSLYILNQDYFLGDKVKIKLPVGNTVTARIAETIESWDNDGYNTQLRLKYISEEDATQLLAAESGDLITDEDGNNIEVEGAEYGEY